jgi:hypothetical protein
LLALDQGATRVQRAHEALKADELWQGNAYVVHPQPDQAEAAGGTAPGTRKQVLTLPTDHAVYFRLAEQRTLAAELFAALMAQALGLPTPQPYVLRIDPGTLPGSRFAPPAGSGKKANAKPLLCVATQDMGGQAFAQLLAEQSAFAQKLMRDWDALVPATTFDEWIANPDRNFGNILFIAQRLLLIDHAAAFAGPHRALLPLHELADKPLTNKLALLLAHDSPSRRKTHLESARRWLTQTARALNLPQTARHASHWHSADDEQALLTFLNRRLDLAHPLLCTRLGYPQLGL